jgi:predicted transcriptional regulator
MNTAQREDLLLLLKTLADEQRLTMVALMNDTERTVSEMSNLLKLSDPTVSHHVSKLHSAGLLRLRMAGNQRFYSLNPARLEKFKAYVTEIEQLPTETPAEESDDRWIDALDCSPEDKKVLREYTRNGKLIQFPAKEKKFMVIMRWVASLFDPGVQYTEKQINAVLGTVNEDFATLRRSLIEYGFMRRERAGSHYWLTPDEE